MSVIREDVVQISYDIQDNPFQELINEINQMKRAIMGATDNGEDGLQDIVDTARQASSSMKDLAQEARKAGNANLDGLNQSVKEVTEDVNNLKSSTKQAGNANMNGFKRSVQDTARETKRMNITLTALIAKSAVLSKLRLAMAFQSLKVVPRTVFNKITGGLHKMKNGFSNIKNMRFKGLLSSLNQIAGKGLLKGIQGAKQLWAGLKKAASVSFLYVKGQVTALIPKMKQLGIASMKVFGKGIMKGIKGFGAGVMGVGKMAVKATKMTSVAMLGASAAAFKVGMDFDSSMSQVAATMGMSVEGIHDKTSQEFKDFEKLNQAAREQGKNTKFSAAQAGDALNYLALAGYNTKKAVGALPTVLNLTQAGGMELAETSDMITDSMSALGIEATQKKLTTFGDQMAKTAQKSNTSVKQLGSAILTVGGTAKNLHGATKELQTAEMNTALGILADSGIKGSEGGTKLRNMIQSLTPTTKPAIEAFKKLGVSAYDAKGRMRPLEDTFTDITKKMAGMTDEEKTKTLAAMFNKTDLKAVNAMMAATEVKDGTNRFQDLKAKILDSNGAMADMADTMNDNLKGRLTELGSATSEVGIAFTRNLMEPAKDTVKEIAGWMGDLGTSIDERGFNGFVDGVGVFTQKIIHLLADSAPQGMDAVMQMIESLVGSFEANEQRIANSGVKVLMSFVKGMSKIIPRVLILGAKLISDFLTGVAEHMPEMMQQGQEGIQQLIQGLMKEAPTIIQSGMQVIMMLLQGLVDVAPLLMSGAVYLINSLLLGIQQNLPQLSNSAIYIIMALIQGIIQVLPNLITVALQLIFYLAEAIIQNLPAIAGAGFQIIIILIKGIFEALPMLVKLIWDALVALVDLILSTDWIEVGKQLIGSIGDGIMDGIKGFFGGGKEAAEETKEGFTSGMSDFTFEMPQFDTSSMYSNGHSGGQRYFDGMNAGMTGTELIAPNIDTSSYYQTGQQGGKQINQGVNDELSKSKPRMSTDIGLEKLGIKSVDTTEVQNSFQQVTSASNQMQADVSSSVQAVNQATSELSKNTGFSDLSNSAKKSMKSINTSTTQGMNQMRSTVARGLNGVVSNFRSSMASVRSIVSSTNLYTTGQNIVSGLINGINSKKQQLIETAKAMGNAIETATNKKLDIHSPSRVMKQTGANVVLGTKIGMEDTFGELRKTSQKMGTHVKEDTEKKATPQSRYSPSNTSTVQSNQSSTSFLYNPTFQFHVSGSVDKQTEFKLKKLMKEVLKEDKEQMKRLYPRLREV